jgi:hypothetical protein
MEDCINEIRIWMAHNFLKLNSDKTEYLLIDPRNKADLPSILIDDDCIDGSDMAWNIGCVMDNKLKLNGHINNICKCSYANLRNISRMRRYISTSDSKTVIHSVVISRLDYLNSLLYGLPQYQIKKLQRLQNTATRVVTQQSRYCHMTPVLNDLHWLPVKYRIIFKVLLLVFKCLHGCAPEYLQELIQRYQPSRSLRSADKCLLVVPKIRTKTYGERAFSVCGPSLWNELPINVKQCGNINIFKSKLKTHLFVTAYN